MHLFQEIFYEKDPLRLEEYLYCINRNIINPLIEKIHLVYNIEEFNGHLQYFSDITSKKLKQSNKIELIPSNNKRFTFGDFSVFANTLLPENTIVAVCNLDIFFPSNSSAWDSIDKSFFSIVKTNGCLALARTEYINEVWQYKEEIGWQKGEFCDCWSFMTPIKFTKIDFPFDISVGNAPTCDNYMFGFLSKKYKRVFNWADKYVVYHFDLIRKPKKIVDRYNIMITNESTLKLPDKHEWIQHITPYQDWEKILNEEFVINNEHK